MSMYAFMCVYTYIRVYIHTHVKFMYMKNTHRLVLKYA